MLELKNLTISHGSQRLFGKIELQVMRGQIQTLMGPSGCGKSTLLAAVAGTLAEGLMLQGDICLGGQSLIGVPQRKRQVGILFQDDLLFPHFNVAQNLQFAIPSKHQTQAAALIENSLDSAGLQGYQLRDVATLSGGERARISLLRCLLAKPRALLLDEPFAKLDQARRSQFRDFVTKQIKAQGIPALLVSHDKQDCIEGMPLDMTALGSSYAAR